MTDREPPREARFGDAIRNRRADGTRGPTTVVPVRWSPAELAHVDALALPGESRSDTIRRVVMSR